MELCVSLIEIQRVHKASRTNFKASLRLGYLFYYWQIIENKDSNSILITIFTFILETWANLFSSRKYKESLWRKDFRESTYSPNLISNWKVVSWKDEGKKKKDEDKENNVRENLKIKSRA